MAVVVLYHCGFEIGRTSYYVSRGWTSDSDSMLVVNTSGKVHKDFRAFGSQYSLGSTSGGVRVATSPVLTGATRFLHFWNDVCNTSMSVTFLKSGSPQFTCTFNASDGKVYLYRGGTPGEGGTLVFTSAATALTAGGHWWAVRLIAQDVDGVAQVFVDGSDVATWSGDTQGYSSSGWDQVRWSGLSATDWLGRYIDDVIITDDDSGTMLSPLAECYGYPLKASGMVSGTCGGFPEPSARYSNIAHVPGQQVSYVSGIVGSEDLYSYEDLPGAYYINTIPAVGVDAETLVVDSVLDTELRIKSGVGTVYMPKAYPTPSSWTPQDWSFGTNPVSSSSWTLDDVQALQVGIRFNS